MAKTLKVAAVQLRSTRELKGNVEKICRYVGEARAAGCRLVVFPECAVTGYFEDAIGRATPEQLEDAHYHISAAAHSAGINVVTGTVLKREWRVENVALAFSARGEIIDDYAKVQLAGEKWCTAGQRLTMYKVDDVVAATIICHDERYPELVRLRVLAGAKLVVYVSHESGIREEHKIAPYRAQVVARAVENGVALVQANAPANEDTTGSHGQSRIITHRGEILVEASMFKDEMVTAEVAIPDNTGEMGRHSLRSPMLAGWWREGMKLVKPLAGAS